MSEYQYYEFYSIDRELTIKEIEEVDELSSRFSPTSRRAVFTYSYSDFKYDVEEVLLNYFDFFLYTSNWGTRRLMYKFPKALINYKELKQYEYSYEGDFTDSGIRIIIESEYVILDVNFSQEEGYEWIVAEDSWSSFLMGLRGEILGRDYRSLFLIWLHIKNLEYESGQIDLKKKIKKKLIPPNLSQLNKNLESLMNFFEVDQDWVLGASKYSETKIRSAINYKRYVEELPEEVKEEYLLKILSGESNLSLKLRHKIDSIHSKNNSEEEQEIVIISLEQLLHSIEAERKKRIVREQKQIEKNRVIALKKTEQNKKEIFEEIDIKIRKGTAKSYDEALIRILELRDLAIYKQDEASFKSWIEDLKIILARKKSMLKRMEDENL